MAALSYALLPTALLIAGCVNTTSVSASCSDCHGSPDTNWAPPKALGGETDIEFVGVGTHQAHVTGAGLGSPVACSECHRVPAKVWSPGHMDDGWPAEVTWGPLTTGGEAREVTWDPLTQTCSNSYCHAGSGALVPIPVWNSPSSAVLACTGCHGDPPPPPHPTGACADCHQPTASESGGLGSPATHMDGRVTLSFDRPGGDDDDDDTGSTVAGCEGCHGDANSLAPPPDTSGLTDTTERTVGAHRAHVEGSSNAAAVACGDCHVVPEAVGDAGHLDPAPAEVVFSGRSLPAVALPSWDGGSLTCSNTYCHGADSSGGAHLDPTWTTVDGSQSTCGSCHGMPPTESHPPSTTCESCHGSVVAAGNTITAPLLHINGVTDF